MLHFSICLGATVVAISCESSWVKSHFVERCWESSRRLFFFVFSSSSPFFVLGVRSFVVSLFFLVVSFLFLASSFFEKFLVGASMSGDPGWVGIHQRSHHTKDHITPKKGTADASVTLNPEPPLRCAEKAIRLLHPFQPARLPTLLFVGQRRQPGSLICFAALSFPLSNSHLSGSLCWRPFLVGLSVGTSFLRPLWASVRASSRTAFLDILLSAQQPAVPLARPSTSSGWDNHHTSNTLCSLFLVSDFPSAHQPSHTNHLGLRCKPLAETE